MASRLLKQGGTNLGKVQESDPADTRTVEEIAAAAAEVPPPRSGEPATQDPSEKGIVSFEQLTPAAIAQALPDLHEPRSDSLVLEVDERAELDRYETLLRFADGLFWVEGRSFEGIRIAELHREKYTSFDAYCLDVWGKSARRVNQLREVWRLGEFLSTEAGKNFPALAINESQTRALLPLAKEHGNEAAAFVLQTLAGGDRKVTAMFLKGALNALPRGRFDRDEVAQLLNDYLRADIRVIPPAHTSAGDAEDPHATEWDAAFGRLRSTVTRAVQQPAFLGAARVNRDKALADLAQLDEMIQSAIKAVQAEQ